MVGPYPIRIDFLEKYQGEKMAEKKNQMEWKSELSSEEIEFTKPEVMAKFVSTIDEDGYPHITFITSNVAISAKRIKWGEFTRGRSKGHVVKRPQQGIIYMNVAPPFKFLQAKVKMDSWSLEGSDAEDFNKMMLFRYNTYMRVYRVFFNDLIAARPLRPIPLMGIVKGVIQNKLKSFGKTGTPDPRLEKIGNQLFNGGLNPKFLSYIDTDGYPVILPVFQARAVEGKTIAVPYTQFKEDLMAIPDGAKVSVFAMNFESINQMVKGTVKNKESWGMMIDIEKIYNSMPPKAGYLYPKKEIKEKVVVFG
jgi:hypothetical protein